MTKKDALKKKYCKYCAAYDVDRGCRGGAADPTNKGNDCILPANVQERFRAERGLEGETQRLESGKFGDRDLMKKPRRRRSKRL